QKANQATKNPKPALQRERLKDTFRQAKKSAGGTGHTPTRSRHPREYSPPEKTQAPGTRKTCARGLFLLFFHQTDTGVSAAGAGLVHSATSDTGSTDKAFRAERGARRAESAYGTRPAIAGAIEIDPHAVRLRRLKKNVITSARLHEQELQGRRYKAAMVTLTYRDDVEWTPKQVTGYLKAVREWYRRKHGQALRYVWVLELTKRGRPHYHVLF